MSKRPKTSKKEQLLQKYQVEVANYIQELEEEESEEGSSTTDITITSLRDTSTMSDSETTSTVHLRRKLERIYEDTEELKEQLLEQRTEENAATSDYEMLQETADQLELYKEEYAQLNNSISDLEVDPTKILEDKTKAKRFRSEVKLAKLDCKYLLSARSLLVTAEALENSVKCLVPAFEAEPERLHTAAVELVMETAKDLTAKIKTSPLPERHEIKQRAQDARQQATLILGRMSKIAAADTKPVIYSGSGKGGVKVKPMDVPEFSGKTEDWASFFRLFKSSIHDNPDLETSTKLHHLVQALKDPVQKTTYAERMDEVDAYNKLIKELTAKYDKPRWMHRNYCQKLKDLTTNQHNREGLTQLVGQVTQIYSGLQRLKATDAKHILTSLTESIMDVKLKELWYQRTDTIKETPPIEDLLEFITAQANQLEEVPSKIAKPGKDHYFDKKKIQQSKYKGSSHVTVPTSSQRSKPARQQQNVYSGQAENTNYTCSVCQEGHLLFYCPLFKAYTITQRKEHIVAHKLCWNCMKPHHVAADCNSSYRCKAAGCGKKHNTMLHEERPTAPTHQTNTVIHSDDEEELQDCLLMTSQVTVVGPTGKYLAVRALLDSGSTISILATRVMKYLKLKDTGKTVSISGVSSSSTNRRHPLAAVILNSEYKPDWNIKVMVAGMDKVTKQLPQQEATTVRNLQHIKDLVLADENFDQPGNIELLLGQDVCRQLFLPGIKRGTKREPEAWHTVFGWTITGNYSTCSKAASQTAITHTVSTTPDLELSTDVLLQKFFVLEEPPAPKKKNLSTTEEQVEKHFEETHRYVAEENRYMVRLPRVDDSLTLGESKTTAINRARSNERSLIRKGKLQDFQAVMAEYVELNHSQKVNQQMKITGAESYYMPIHSVIKESSSSTKLRAVFDASARTTNQISLNDLLAVGPTLHPPLDHILLNFRSYAVALTGDITKMYREVLLHPLDQALHRYIWKKDSEEDWSEYQMKRVTFGVTASPYLAVRVLQQVAHEFGKDLPKAQWHILQSFYVDDLMGGADSEKEAVELYEDLNKILQKASFTLKKWRSSSTKVLQQIPGKMQEKLPLQDLVDMHSASYPKALGVTWNSRKDSMSISTNISEDYVASKRGIISDIARTFDVLGWVSPVILPMKILYKEVWKTGVDWDDNIEKEQEGKHRTWREELPSLSDIDIPRHYFQGKVPVTKELHGYSDASEAAFGAVIYIRATYPSGPPSTKLVISKTRISPPKTRTIPQLELCGAHLLAKLMTTTRETLGIPLESCFANSDSTVVLAWIDQAPHKYQLYVANRLSQTTAMLPAKAWKFVPTQFNPADVATRGATVTELKNHDLWWQGPPWLLEDPVQYPEQPKEAIYQKLRHSGLKKKEVVVNTAVREACLEDSFNSYKKLIRVVCWLKRLGQFGRTKIKNPDLYLTTAEAKAASDVLITRSQQRSFSEELRRMTADPPQEISQRSTILTLRPMVDDKGILRIGGRLNHTKLPEYQKHPILISADDPFSKLLFLHYHLQLGHCGPSALLAHSGNVFYVKGGKRLARSVCSKCIKCRMAAVRASTQLLGQLPPARVEPNYVFLHTGLDLAGPFYIRKGHTRRPVFIKSYLIIFVCFCTKAVHLELASDQTKEAFLAALDRFVSRRGLPLHIYSDHGANFMGARNELLKYYHLIKSADWQESISSFSFDYEITWHTIPQRAPHFGGLWESAVKSAKYHIKRVVAGYKFTFEELYTVFCKVESYLNSRPLGPITSHDLDGSSPLTPAHFLLGRSARAYPRKPVTSNPTILQRWEKCLQASQHFWSRWSQEYLQQLQKATKWHKKKKNFEVGDLVMLTDGKEFGCQWTMAKIVSVFPGKDGLVRSVDVQVEHVIVPKDSHSKEDFAKKLKTRTAIYRRPITKLSMLLAADEGPEGVSLDGPEQIPEVYGIDNVEE